MDYDVTEFHKKTPHFCTSVPGESLWINNLMQQQNDTLTLEHLSLESTNTASNLFSNKIHPSSKKIAAIVKVWIFIYVV